MDVSGELQTLGQRKSWLYVISFSRNGLSGPIVRPMTVPVARVISVYQAQETKCSLEGAMTVPLQDVLWSITDLADNGPSPARLPRFCRICPSPGTSGRA